MRPGEAASRTRTPRFGVLLSFAFVAASIVATIAPARVAFGQARDAPAALPATRGGSDAMPTRHPPIGDADGPGGRETRTSPHGGANAHGSGGDSGESETLFEPLPDTVNEDANLATGAIAVEIRDAKGAPSPHALVNLGILHNTVAKGEKRESLVRESDDAGNVVFEHLENVSGVAYRVSVPKDGATFATPAFSLPRERGMRAVLHVYPVVHAVIPLDKLGSLDEKSTRDRALVVVEGILFAELKEDRIQVQQLFRLVNAGGNAWVPEGVVPNLPSGFSALVNGSQEASDVGIEADTKGAKWRGTFSPGKHEVTYRWQLPWNNDENVSFDVALPPNVVSMRVMTAASDGMRLAVDGFPPGEPQTDGQGQRMLVTEKQLHRGESLIATVNISMKNLPVVGRERFIVTGLAGLTLAFGLAFALSNRRPETPAEDAKARRGLLLADLEELERAHRAGDIGPKTYERTRRQLIDGIARTLIKSATASVA
jgi:hypothetical protein